MEEQNQQNQLDNFFNLAFDQPAKDHLKNITLWAKICALCAFGSYAISLVVAFFGRKDYTMEAEGFSFGAYLRTGRSPLGVIITVLIGGIINYFLYRFATAARQGLESMDSIKLNEGLSSLRTYFKIYGILLVIALVFVGLVFIILFFSVALTRR